MVKYWGLPVSSRGLLVQLLFLGWLLIFRSTNMYSLMVRFAYVLEFFVMFSKKSTK